MDIKKLLNEMSLEEKVGQLTQLNCSFFKENTAEITGPASALGIDAEDGKYAGSVLNFDCATTMRTVQEIAVRRHPHHIPLLFMQDVIHGYKTIYPIPLAMGCSFDKELVRDCANMAAKEAASSGVQVTFGPMVDLVRDARWGRVMESTGEDPYLNSVLAAAQVEGYQGDMTKDHNIAACVKHFAAYGAAEAGRDYNTVDMSERTMREFYLKGYKGAIDAKVKMIMTSFNTIAGEPATGMKLLFTDILRDEWNFDGSIISDYNAFREMIKHGVVENEKEAAKKALLAGNEIEMMSATIYKYAKELIDEGIISIEQIDKAVLRVLRLKEELGLFDNPYRYASVDNEKSNHLCKEHRALSRKAATKSSVLLKNNGVLPFSIDVKKIAVIGPFADEKEIIGSWSCVGKSDDTISVVEGIKNIVPSSIIKVEKGCTWKGEDLDIDSAVNVAKESDIVILCLGEHQSWSGEGNSRAMLELPRNQIKLAEEIVKVNKNTAVVLFNGRPLAIKDLDDIAPAILDMWQPGTEGGNACAELLFGLANPEGKVTMTFPLCTGQEPIYYNHLPTALPAVSSVRTSDSVISSSRSIPRHITAFT
ncbi:MAG: glycoside hydrolase family 3 C-terminal domain-containing protein [Clostridia bacterium]|nr:glycoside hydrolase family 3 C-terminal domain-containing protein [Clostridia bacterium]